MQVLISIFYFLAILSVLVIAHEWGHFVVAKLCKMHVEDFSLFFGKVIWRIGERNGTVYNVRAIPLGGFVKIAGMEPDDISNGAPIFQRSAGGKIKLLRGLGTESFENVDFEKISERVQKAASASVEDGELTSGGRAEIQALLESTAINDDEHRYLEALISASQQTERIDPNGYNQKPLWQRAAVIFAGPFMSVVFGYFLFCFMGVTTGFPDDRDTLSIIKTVKGGVADKAGLKDGDRIVRVGTVETPTWEAFRAQIQPRPGESVKLTVQRGGQMLDIAAIPSASDDPESGKKVGRLGVTPGSQKFTWRRYTLVGSVEKGTAILKANLQGILNVFRSGKEIRENVGGPIAIATVVHEMGKEGLGPLFGTAASISVSLGVMNLLPIPILDGGHLLLLGIEFVRRRKMTSREVATAQMIGLSIIGVMFVLVMYNDITRLIFKR